MASWEVNLVLELVWDTSVILILVMLAVGLLYGRRLMRMVDLLRDSRTRYIALSYGMLFVMMGALILYLSGIGDVVLDIEGCHCQQAHLKSIILGPIVLLVAGAIANVIFMRIARLSGRTSDAKIFVQRIASGIALDIVVTFVIDVVVSMMPISVYLYVYIAALVAYIVTFIYVANEAAKVASIIKPVAV